MTDGPLVLHDITLAYRPGKPVLDGIGLTLARGSVMGLLGRNGAGKTTLMRVALGLLRPDGGSAELFGEGAWNASPGARKRIGYVPQADAPFGWMRVVDCLAVVSSFHATWDEALVRRYLGEWDVDASAYIQDLSQGQRQKVSILLAIGHRPELLVLDEPVASLDPGARRQFLRALVELNQELGGSILFSTHITSDLERVAADIAVLHHGGLEYCGPLDDLKEGCRRLHFRGNPLPEALAESGIGHYLQSGDRASAFARNWSEQRTSSLSHRLGVQVTAESLPLEELFLELTNEP